MLRRRAADEQEVARWHDSAADAAPAESSAVAIAVVALAHRLVCAAAGAAARSAADFVATTPRCASASVRLSATNRPAGVRQLSPTSVGRELWHALDRGWAAAAVARRELDVERRRPVSQHSTPAARQVSRRLARRRRGRRRTSCRESARAFMGPVVRRRRQRSAAGTDHVEIRFQSPVDRSSSRRSKVRSASPGTPRSARGRLRRDRRVDDVEMRANDSYYLGKPAIERIVVTHYPSVRAAWAEMLRGQHRHAVRSRRPTRSIRCERRTTSRSSRSRAAISTSIVFNIQSAALQSTKTSDAR